ncbi:MAG TPA: MATE family efflux transporter [Polyangia bacterium]|nr:MATE family efflux transporter [Polyangia bacterium]
MQGPPLAPSTAQPVPARLWASLREAIVGTQQDFTEGALGRAILLLAVPMVMEMAMESLFTIVDVLWVARLGADAVAAVGVVDSLVTLIFAVAMGLSVATTAIVARRIGEKDPAAGATAAVQAIALGIVVAALLGVVLGALAPALLRLMGASPEVVSVGTGFARVMLSANVTIMLLFLINAVFRGAGDAAIAMRTLWLANFINLVLDPCLIFGLGPFPRLGLTGAAVATSIGRGIGVAYQLWVLGRGRGRIVIRSAQIRPQAAVMLNLLRLSLGGMFQILVASASWLGLVRILAHFGSAALAGYTIALRIIIFAILPSWGMSNAAATLVGQNLGARKPERAERAAWLTGFYNMCFLGGVGALFIVFAEPLIGIFTHDPAVVPIGVDCLRFVSYGYLFYAYGMVMVQSFNGAGDTVTPTLINLACYWLWQIPLAFGLSRLLGLGPRGVFLAITISESTIAVVGMLAFRRGRWKERKV